MNCIPSSSDLMDYRPDGLQNCWTIELLYYRTTGLKNYWNTELLDY